MLMPQVIEGKQYMTTAEAARYLNMSVKTFRDKYVRKKDKAHLFILKLEQYENPSDTREKLYLVSDLESLKGIRPK